MMTRTLLFFSPYSYHRPNRIAQAKTAKALSDEGFEIHWLSAEFSRALVHPDRNDLEIEWCIEFDRALAKRLEFKLIRPTSSLLTELSIEVGNELTAACSIEQIEAASVDSVKFGKYCLADTLVRERAAHFDLSLVKSKVFQALFADSVFCGKLAARMSASEEYEAVFCYIAGYAPHRTFCEVFDQRGIAYCSYEGGVNYGYFFTLLRAYMGNQIDGMMDTLAFGNEKCLSQPAIAHRIVEGSAHLAVSMGRNASTHCYSESPGRTSGSQIREFFGIRDGQKLVLAVTSSEDEMRAATVNKQPQLWDALFASQKEWLACLLDLFRRNPDLFLIIRVHPREFYGGETRSARELLEFLQDLPENVRLNVPNDGLSLYDVAKETELLLCNYSSCGSEFLQMGIPVIKYCESLMYPTSHGLLVNESVAAYEEAVLDQVGAIFNPVQIQEIFRWIAFLRSGNLVDINLGGLSKNSASRAIWKEIVRLIEQFPFSEFSKRWLNLARRRLDICSLVDEVASTRGEGSVLERLLSGRTIVDSRIEENAVECEEWFGIEQAINSYSELVYGSKVDGITIEEPLARRFKTTVSFARERQ